MAAFSAMQNIKLVSVGDQGSGKTSMFIAYTTGSVPDYIPTVFDNYTSHVKVDHEDFKVALWDTAGQDDYDRLRPLSYPQTDVFLLCYNRFMRTSFESITTKWLPEISHHLPGCPFVLVASCDETPHAEGDPVTTAEGEELALVLGAHRYCEYSVLTKKGLVEVFEEAVRSTLLRPRIKGKYKRKTKLNTFAKKMYQLTSGLPELLRETLVERAKKEEAESSKEKSESLRDKKKGKSLQGEHSEKEENIESSEESDYDMGTDLFD